MRNAVTHRQSRILANPALAEIAAGYSPNEAETAAGPQHPSPRAATPDTGGKRHPNAVRRRMPNYEIRHGGSGGSDF